MSDNEPINWSMVNALVKPEHQYLDVKDLPLDSVRMAWPFKTEDELKLLSKWFKEQKQITKQKELKDAGDALL